MLHTEYEKCNVDIRIVFCLGYQPISSSTLGHSYGVLSNMNTGKKISLLKKRRKYFLFKNSLKSSNRIAIGFGRD